MEDRLCDVLGPADPADGQCGGDAGEEGGPLLLRDAGPPRGVDDAGRDRVDAQWCEVDGARAEGDHQVVERAGRLEEGGDVPGRGGVGLPDTGTLRADLAAFFRAGFDVLRDEGMARLLGEVVSGAQREPAVAEVLRDFTTRRRAAGPVAGPVAGRAQSGRPAASPRATSSTPAAPLVTGYETRTAANSRSTALGQ